MLLLVLLAAFCFLLAPAPACSRSLWLCLLCLSALLCVNFLVLYFVEQWRKSQAKKSDGQQQSINKRSCSSNARLLFVRAFVRFVCCSDGHYTLSLDIALI